MKTAIDELAATTGGIVSNTAEVTGSDVITNIISMTQAEYNAGPKNASTYHIITDATPATATTGTALDMGSFVQYNMAAANSATSYTLTNIKQGGYVEVFINAATEPTVTGATKFPNTAAFIANTNMILSVKALGSVVKYFFAEY